MSAQDLIDAYHSRRSDPRHPALVDAAAKRGFRPATIAEICDDALLAEKYIWCGEVWCRATTGDRSDG